MSTSFCTKKINTFCCLKKLDIGVVDLSRRSLIGYFLHYILQWPPWERKTSLLCVSHRFCTFSDSGIWVTGMPQLVSTRERVIKMSCDEMTFKKYFLLKFRFFENATTMQFFVLNSLPI